MFGGPIDMTPFGAIVKGIGVIYWLLVLGALTLALWKPRRWWLKLSLSGVVLAAGVVPVAIYAYQEYQQQKQAKARLDAAMAHFEMRCKSAGERIYRTVENVDGVVWMKWRSKWANDDDQFSIDDPYGRDCGAGECVEQLLRLENTSGRFKQEVERRKGRYNFVESIDPADGKSYRYIGAMTPGWSPEGVKRHREQTGQDIPDDAYRFSMNKQPIPQITARYGIAWDDISTKEDREQWVAGGSLKVIDLQTNELIAERIGYLWDTGLGSKAGFRSPWGWAVSHGRKCPKLESSSLGGRTVLFVKKSLKSRKED